MADSIRETIIKAFVARASDISGTGYNHSLGSHVYRALKEVDPSCLPAIVIWPQREQVTRREFGKYRITMPIVVEAIAAFGSTNASVVAEQLLADVRKAFLSNTVISSLIDDMQYTEGGPSEYPDAGQEVVGIQATFAVEYWTDIRNPYA